MAFWVELEEVVLVEARLVEAVALAALVHRSAVDQAVAAPPALLVPLRDYLADRVGLDSQAALPFLEEDRVIQMEQVEQL
tara:strand:+ start:281 stop:520 length:240 start_codon:yes stop_codon:yes gene_type:complete